MRKQSSLEWENTKMIIVFRGIKKKQHKSLIKDGEWRNLWYLTLDKLGLTLGLTGIFSLG